LSWSTFSRNIEHARPRNVVPKLGPHHRERPLRVPRGDQEVALFLGVDVQFED
jgi:hypothetical protein